MPSIGLLSRISVVVLLVGLLSYSAFARDPVSLPEPERSRGTIVRGGPADPAAKAAVDTFELLGPFGGGAPYVGDFEGSVGDGWYGWTTADESVDKSIHWHASDYLPVTGDWSAWCGDFGWPDCGPGDVTGPGGYGNNWVQMLEWRGTVADKTLPTTVNITATMNIDVEPAYDYLYLSLDKADVGFVDLYEWSNKYLGIEVDQVGTYLPAEYVGTAVDEIAVVFRFISDGAFSDENCMWPTDGAVRLDDLTITTDNGAGTGGVVDFEDGTLGPLAPRVRQGVGNFGKVWSNLQDADPCAENRTRQVAFIDDGVVVPGTGGSPCIDWCYGPGGFVVNSTGGLALYPWDHLDNRLLSPVMEWQDSGHDGAMFAYTAYHHDIFGGADAAGIFYSWQVRSSATGDPADILDAPWTGDSILRMEDEPVYRRWEEPISEYLVPGATHIQIMFQVQELGWIWGFVGNNATPAPYFDNMRLLTHPVEGPRLEAVSGLLAQDAFPASGTIDMVDPGALDCRFDTGGIYSHGTERFLVLGDSVVVTSRAIRHDAVLEGPPRMHYRVRRNPLFAPYKTAGLPDAGYVDCTPDLYSNVFSGDLPDEGFLFPGDVVHYYFTATDRDTLTDELRTTILPADTTGFSDFDVYPAYDDRFTVRCLPSIREGDGTQPAVLFWHDAPEQGRAEWHHTFNPLAMRTGFEVDVFTTNDLKNESDGLGASAVAAHLAGYEMLIYTSEDLAYNTLGTGAPGEFDGPDVQLITAWLDTGDKHALLTGAGLAEDLDIHPDARAFLTNVMNVSLADPSIRDLIGGQIAPRVLPVAGQTVFNTVDSWVSYDGCGTGFNQDAVDVTGVGVRLAEYADPVGSGGAYNFSAATLASGLGTAGTSEVISLPTAFARIHTDPAEGSKAPATLPVRTRVLNDIMARFGQTGGMGDPVGVPGAREAFTVANRPNPFNPATRISYTVPRPGRLTLKVYNIRGRLVKTVLDGRVTEAGAVDWDGTDARGARVASGIYFYEARLHDDVKVGKMALVK